MEKVCRTCHWYNSSEETCTYDNFDVTNPIPDALLNLFDMGEFLGLLEEHIPDENKRIDLENAAQRLVSNVFEDLGNPKIKILAPESFGCNKWF